MKKVIVLLLLLSACYIGNSQSNSDRLKNNVVKKIILIDQVPTEVLMNKNGDILAKLNVLPDYLKKYEVQDSVIDISNVKVESTEILNTTIVANETSASSGIFETSNPVNSDLNSSNNQEIKFKIGTAFIDPSQISILNDLINQINNGLISNIKLYGFINEPVYRSAILSQRRMEAILAYMKVKGVDIDNSVVIGNSVNGQNNKIVLVASK
jgi:hypothetical protein